MLTQAQKDMLQRIGLGVLEAVDSAKPDGAPSGVLYAAMQAHGATLNQFQSFMDGLTKKAMLALDDHHRYHITSDGEAYMLALQRKFAI